MGEATRDKTDMFPRYHELNWLERVVLKRCCYFPPRRAKGVQLDDVCDTDHYQDIYERAFGPELWKWINGRRVLDLGCGHGGFVLALARRDVGEVVGLDLQDNFGLAAEEGKRRAYENVRFVQGDISSIRSESFDVAISHDSFEHFEDPAGVLDEMVRVVRPGGRIVIKFGPPWRNPWGRHMKGTVRKDRPWVHLVLSERVVMRCHSVYHDKSQLLERYAQLPGGLNKMTVRRFKRILRRSGLQVLRVETRSILGGHRLTRLPWIGEFFAAGVAAVCLKSGG